MRRQTHDTMVHDNTTHVMHWQTKDLANYGKIIIFMCVIVVLQLSTCIRLWWFCRWDYSIIIRVVIRISQKFEFSTHFSTDLYYYRVVVATLHVGMTQEQNGGYTQRTWLQQNHLYQVKIIIRTITCSWSYMYVWMMSLQISLYRRVPGLTENVANLQ